MEPQKISYNKDNLHYTYQQLFTSSQAEDYFTRLENEITYLTGSLVKVYGKWYDIPRQHVAHGTSSYTFSGARISAKPWTPLLLELKHIVERETNCKYNFVLINRYRSGNDYIGFHQDDEDSLVQDAPIASLSFGQKRDFVFKRQGFDTVTLGLDPGSLLVMWHPTNIYWKHGLPQRKKLTRVRINLTFRKMIE